MESGECAGVEPRTLSQLYRKNRLSAVHVDRRMLKIDPFRERNSVLIQGNDKHTTVTSFWSGRFMFPNNSPGALVPLGLAPLGPPRAAEGERQATIRELMPYFLGYGKVELRWAAGTLEKYEDAMGCVIRWLGEIPPGR